MSAFNALDLHTTVGVHTLVSAQIGELRVRLKTNFALEGFHAAVDVGVLFQAGTGREGLAALCASVAPRAHVMRSDMTL